MPVVRKKIKTVGVFFNYVSTYCVTTQGAP